MRRPTGLLLGVVLLAACLLAAGPGGAPARAAAPGVEDALVRSLAGAGLSLDRTAAVAVDLRTGETLFEHRADAPMIPASNEKLAVTFAALRLLGPSFRFHTDVVGLGDRRGPVWDGDLVLVGDGDPTLGTDAVRRLVGVLRGRGIRTVTGDVIGDETLFDRRRDAPGWKPSFLGLESGPLSALVLDRGRSWPGPPLAPGLAAARALHAALEAAHVDVLGTPRLGTVPEGGTGDPLARVASAPLADLVARANTDSDNFVAEMLLKRLGALEAQPGTTGAGAALVLRTLAEAGVPTGGLRIADGSGLSRLDRMTPRALVAILREGLRDPRFGAAFRRSLAVAGRSGTLEHRLATLHGRVRGKTGTTSVACSLTAIVSSRIAFSVIANGAALSSWAARAAQDRFAALLARLPR